MALFIFGMGHNFSFKYLTEIGMDKVWYDVHHTKIFIGYKCVCLIALSKIIDGRILSPQLSNGKKKKQKTYGLVT